MVVARRRPAVAGLLGEPGRREYIETSLARENAGAPRSAGYAKCCAAAWCGAWCWCLFVQVGFYGLNLWLPHLVKDTIGGSYLVIGAVAASPYVFAIAGLWINARSADRTGRYSVHVAASLAIGAVALVLAVAFGSIVALSVFLISVAMAGALAYDGPFWASSSAPCRWRWRAGRWA